MNSRSPFQWLSVILSLLGRSLLGDNAPPDGSLLKPGDSVVLGDRQATVRVLSSLAYVENEYTKRFRFDSLENPKLKELRDRHRLTEVIAPGHDEFDQQVCLMAWTHHQFKKLGWPSTNAQGALEILQSIDDGQTFFCAQFAEVLVSAAASLGWVDRSLALRRLQGVAQVGGSTEHSTTEIWSNQHRKWVMLDPTSNLYLEKNGVPLNAFEIREEWFYRGGTNLVFVIGPERKKYRKSELPIFRRSFAEFGDQTVSPDELDKYGFIGYLPNTDLLGSGYDYGKMFIVKDSRCNGNQWHVRTVPTYSATDPYFPLGQAALNLRAEDGSVRVALKTLTQTSSATRSGLTQVSGSRRVRRSSGRCTSGRTCSKPGQSTSSA